LDMDVVHVFWSRHAGMVLAVLGRLGMRARRSAFVGAYDLVADDFLVDVTLGWSDVVFSHAEANRAYLERKVPRNTPVHIVHRGIPLIAPDDSLVRDPNLWITASSLTPAKNVEGVLQAFALARRLRPELTLAIYGEGEDRSRLEQCSRDLGCADAVRFGGHVRREELFREMQQAAVFIMLSKKASERLPNVVKEALWAGCALISSNSEGIEALIPDTAIGHVIDPDNASAVDAAVQSVLAETPDQANLRRLGARELIATHFSSELGMRQYVAAWRGQC
ncbi:MAG: glycosyltransferase, partial [Verrucomicrobiaceae bacterium]